VGVIYLLGPSTLSQFFYPPMVKDNHGPL